jgi:3-isopropylmalate/(R)-2-methylmalate dehydratase small subunit
MERFKQLTSRTALLLRDNVDTDQIIPARFLKTTTKEGLGRSLFADWRYDASGAPRADFPLREDAGEILVVGRNFGCGSSREHAVWALRDFGFRAILGTTFADIFRGNAVQNGLLLVSLPEEAHQKAVQGAGAEVTVDLEAGRVTFPDGEAVPFRLDPFARYCLLNGTDALEFLLGEERSITTFEERRKRP